jgi:osmotically-inducible protein OsmY
VKPERNVKSDVESELAWDPETDATNLAVSEHDGVVTLLGYVHTYLQKWHAERAAKRVAGVVAVANEIEVRVPTVDRRPDPEIAQEAVSALMRELPYSAQTIQVLVSDGWITLEGHVDYANRRDIAEDAVRHVRGVSGVTNSLAVNPGAPSDAVQQRIEDALERNAHIDASCVTVQLSGTEVILKGTVSSLAAREAAQRAAGLAPGITRVVNQITVDRGARSL